MTRADTKFPLFAYLGANRARASLALLLQRLP
jgi:hypothetical protein